MYRASHQHRRRVRKKRRKRHPDQEYTPQINALSLAMSSHLINRSGQLEQNTVLMLQRTVGNQATQAILQRQLSLKGDVLEDLQDKEDSARQLDDEMIQFLKNKTLKVLTIQPDKLVDWRETLDEVLSKRAQEYDREALTFFMALKDLLDKREPDLNVLPPLLQKLVEDMQNELKLWQDRKTDSPLSFINSLGERTHAVCTYDIDQRPAWKVELEKIYKEDKQLNIIDRAYVLALIAVTGNEDLPPFYKDLDPRMIELIEFILEEIKTWKKAGEQGEVVNPDNKGNKGNNPLSGLFNRGKKK